MRAKVRLAMERKKGRGTFAPAPPKAVDESAPVGAIPCYEMVYTNLGMPRGYYRDEAPPLHSLRGAAYPV